MEFIKTEEWIYDILNELGVPFELSGRDYIVRAVALIYQNGRMAVCKELYSQIAAEFEVSQTTVERCIRYAVEKVFESGKLKMIEKYFSSNIDFDTGKLTNSAFIYGLAEYLRRHR